MGYESFERLPYISSYAQAKWRLENTKPIKKNSTNAHAPDIYPLGDRRYPRKFAIRMAEDVASKPTSRWYARCPNGEKDDIELLLYLCPVITFHADNSVTLFPGETYHWNSTDAKFIEEVLGRYLHSVTTSLRRLVLTTVHGNKIVVERKGSIRLTLNEATRTMTPATKQQQQTLPTVLRINRAKSNEVRKRYGEFYRYLKGMLNLRKEPKTTRFFNYQTQEEVVETEYLVCVSEQEMAEELGTVTRHSGTNNVRVSHYQQFGYVYPVHEKPAKSVVRAKYNSDRQEWAHEKDTESYVAWQKSADNFMQLIKPLEEGEDYERYRRAFLLLVYFTAKPHRMCECEVNVKDVTKMIDQIVFKYHSEEVFYRTTAEPGRVPSLKYEKWVTRDIDDER